MNTELQPSCRHPLSAQAKALHDHRCHRKSKQTCRDTLALRSGRALCRETAQMVLGKQPGFTVTERRTVILRRSCQAVSTEVVPKSRHHFNLNGLYYREAECPIQSYLPFLYTDLFFITANSDQEARELHTPLLICQQGNVLLLGQYSHSHLFPTA